MNAAPIRRAARPEDLYRIVVPTDPRLSPNGRRVTFSVQRVRPGFDGYASSIWIADVDGSADPRPLTIGARRDGHGRWSPDGRTIAFTRYYQGEESIWTVGANGSRLRQVNHGLGAVDAEDPAVRKVVEKLLRKITSTDS